MDKVKAVERKENKIHSQTGQIRRNDDRLPLKTLAGRLVVDRVTGAELETPASLSGETGMKERRTSVWKLLMEGEWTRRGELHCLEASTFGK